MNKYPSNIDLSAPIIAGESIGNIPLGSHISEFNEWMNFSYRNPNNSDTINFVGYGHYTGYPCISYSCFGGAIYLGFNLINGNLANLYCTQGYRGSFLEGIGIGTTLVEAIKIDPSLIFYSGHQAIYSFKHPGITLEVGDLGDTHSAVFAGWADYPIPSILIADKAKLFLPKNYFDDDYEDGIKTKEIW
jgi:hypothetical protein